MEDDNVPVLSGPSGDSTGQYFLAGFVYVSYIDRVDTGHGIYYMLQSGGWIPGKGARVGEYSAFQVYDTQHADGVDWNMIGPDQWMEARIFAVVTPNTTPLE